jgi:outer membrane protein assembly factor BamB
MGVGPVWLTATYDPGLNLAFFGVGNPSPWDANLRKGANLYTNSTVALDVDTGHMKWHHQYHPNDTWDLDTPNEHLPSMELCNKYTLAQDIVYKRGALYIGADFTTYAAQDQAGAVRAIDPVRGETVWEWWTCAPIQAGALWRRAAGSSL